MANVTYLLGAGASAYCLPTYLNFFERFQSFSGFMINYREDILDDIQKRDLNGIKEILKEIIEEFSFHNTPDTIAKKYYHSGEDTKLENLKNILILFFLYEQIRLITSTEIELGNSKFKQSIDKRYDSFIAALLKPQKKKLLLSNQFKILTWNYDLQLEIAFSRYLNRTVPGSQKFIQSFPIIIKDGSEEFDLNKFAIVHLNGLAYAKPDSSRSNKDFIGSFTELNEKILPYLADVYHSIKISNQKEKIGGNNLLNFAWENIKDDGTINENEILEYAVKIAETTQILVIVGYSFPVFNSTIDKYILGKMKQLRKVYVQSVNARDITETILPDLLTNTRLKKEDIINTGYWSQFHIPIEWNKDFSTLS